MNPAPRPHGGGDDIWAHKQRVTLLLASLRRKPRFDNGLARAIRAGRRNSSTAKQVMNVEGILLGECWSMYPQGRTMHFGVLRNRSLTAYDVSSILNLICPGCGGALGGLSEEFRCQGRCRKDWRPDGESSRPNRKLKKTIGSDLRPVLHSTL